MALQYFLGANSPNGFVGRFNDFLYDKNDITVFLIKGGPGSGKSTFMKKVSKALEDKNHKVEQIICSSDPNSLDGVISYDAKIAIFDATLPHSMEPVYIGANQRIVNISQFFDNDYLHENKDEIMKLIDKNSAFHKGAVSYILSASNLIADSYQNVNSILNLAKLENYTKKIIRASIPKKSGIGKEKVRFISAITNQGIKVCEESITAQANKIYMLNDPYGVLAKNMLPYIRQYLLKNGYDIIVSYCVMAAFEKCEHIIVPELSLAFCVNNMFHKIQSANGKTINYFNFVDKNDLLQKKGQLKFNQKASFNLVKQASFQMVKAKENHDEIEKFYIKATDFKKVDELLNKFIETNI